MQSLLPLKPTDQVASDSVSQISHEVGTMALLATTEAVEDRQQHTQKFESVSLSNWLQRPILYQSVTITTVGSGYGTLIHSFYPWDSFLSSTQVADKTKNYMYIRGTIQVICVVSVPGSCYGRCVLSAIPQTGPVVGSVIAENIDFYRCLQVDHCEQIDFSQSNSVVLQLPFIWPYDIGACKSDLARYIGQMWKVSLISIGPLRMAGGLSTSANVKFYLNCLDDVELTVTRYQGRNKLKANDALKSHAPKIHDMIGEGRGSKIASAIGDAADVLSKVPMIGGAASVVSGVAHTAADVLGWFGFSRENREDTPSSFIQRNITNMAQIDTVANADVSSLCRDNKISVDPTLVSSDVEDVAAFSSLCARWTFVGVTTWDPTAVSFTDLLTIPITPFYTPTSGLNYTLSPAGFIGLPFEYWRADTEFKVVVPISNFHRGTLQMIWAPYGTTVPAGDCTGVVVNEIVDIQPGEDYHFKIGFAKDTPYCSSRIYNDLILIPPVDATNGFFIIRILNPLVSTASTDSTKVSVFVRHSNVQFALPRDCTWFPIADNTLVFDSLRDRITLQGKTIGEGSGIVTREYTLYPDSNVSASALSDLYTGETVLSVRGLMQKLSQYTTLSARTAVPGFSLIPRTSVPFTWAGYYSSMFTGIACSERWAIPACSASNQSFGAARLPIGSFGITSATPTMAPMSTSTTGNQGMEFLIPYYTPRKFERPWNYGSTSTETVTLSFNNVSLGTMATYNRYYSFGPDIRLAGFRMLPLVVCLGASASYPKWNVA